MSHKEGVGFYVARTPAGIGQAGLEGEPAEAVMNFINAGISTSSPHMTKGTMEFKKKHHDLMQKISEAVPQLIGYSTSCSCP